jgi:GntR family histidine utilization transcriptional repressor
MTANRALRELVDEGFVTRIAGVGTFVADFKAQSHPLEVRNIADEIARRGHRHTARVLSVQRERAGAEVAHALAVHPGEPVFHLLIVHEESAAPIQLEDRHVLASFAPDCLEQDFTRITPGAYFSAIAPLQAAEHVVRAAMPDELVRRSLRMPRGEPCLLVIRRTWAHGRLVSRARLWHPGSRFEMSGRYDPPGMAPPESGGPLQ